MRHGQHGFTYLMLLWWVAISGVILAALAQSWTMERRRQQDIELVFRAQQITNGIQSYFDAAPNGTAKTLPTSLQDLLEDRRGPVVRHHLRRLWPDPITRQPEWGLIKDGAFIKGVYSQSPLKPVRGDSSLRSYRDWRFLARVQSLSALAASAPSSASPASAVAPMSEVAQ